MGGPRAGRGAGARIALGGGGALGGAGALGFGFPGGGAFLLFLLGLPAGGLTGGGAFYVTLTLLKLGILEVLFYLVMSGNLVTELFRTSRLPDLLLYLLPPIAFWMYCKAPPPLVDDLLPLF